MWLGVWERNPRAIAFYIKSGFVVVGSHVFIVGNDRQTDLVLVSSLSEHVAKKAGGRSNAQGPSLKATAASPEKPEFPPSMASTANRSIRIFKA